MINLIINLLFEHTFVGGGFVGGGGVLGILSLDYRLDK